MVTSLKAENREGLTKSEVKQLRSHGKVPGTVYGKKIGSYSIAVEAKELLALLRSNPHAVVEMEIPQTGKHPVMIHEIQRDKLTREFLHIDFHQINMDEPVRTTIPVDVIGEAPGVREGGILQNMLHEVEIRCLPTVIPESVRVDVSTLGIGDSILVSDLVLPEGVELKSNPDELVITVLATQREPAEPEGTIERPAETADKAAEMV